MGNPIPMSVRKEPSPVSLNAALAPSFARGDSQCRIMTGRSARASM